VREAREREPELLDARRVEPARLGAARAREEGERQPDGRARDELGDRDRGALAVLGCGRHRLKGRRMKGTPGSIPFILHHSDLILPTIQGWMSP
jgi:hypothetical protein